MFSKTMQPTVTNYSQTIRHTMLNHLNVGIVKITSRSRAIYNNRLIVIYLPL